MLLVKVRLVRDECLGCGKCNPSCDLRVGVMGEFEASGEVCSSNCIRCLEYTEDCHEGAIAFALSRSEVSLRSPGTPQPGSEPLRHRNGSCTIETRPCTDLVGFSATLLDPKGFDQHAKTLGVLLPLTHIPIS